MAFTIEAFESVKYDTYFTLAPTTPGATIVIAEHNENQ